jgi:hypothetical protein
VDKRQKTRNDADDDAMCYSSDDEGMDFGPGAA